MYKLLGLLSLIIAVASGQVQQDNKNNGIDEFIEQNRQQYAKNIRDYDKQIESLKQNYTSSLQVIPQRLDFLVNSIVQAEKRLNTLEILSDSTKNCIKKYRSKLPNAITTKQAINACFNTASIQIDSLVNQPLITRNNLDSYYKNTFERNVQNCKVQTGDYNTCVINTISSANTYTLSNQRTFYTQMLAASTRADGNIKTALQCNYSTQNKNTTSIAEVNVLANRCMQGQDECQQCTQGYSCSIITYVQRSEVDYNSLLMKNVFYGNNDVTNCLLVKIVN